MLLVIEDPTLLGVAAIISSIGGVVTTVVGVRRGKQEERVRAEQECQERLKDTRAEAEGLAEELHALKMRRFKDE